MTDRELLELAAKAAGIGENRWSDSHQCLFTTDGPYPNEYRKWNPLTDDGDALRLAVELKLSVCFEERGHHNWTHIIWVSPVFEPYIGDVNAAARRAIVRAAAEIGKVMP